MLMDLTNRHGLKLECCREQGSVTRAVASAPCKLTICEGSQIFPREKKKDTNKQATIDCFRKKKRYNECCTRKSSGVMKRTQQTMPAQSQQSLQPIPTRSSLCFHFSPVPSEGFVFNNIVCISVSQLTKVLGLGEISMVISFWWIKLAEIFPWMDSCHWRAAVLRINY